MKIDSGTLKKIKIKFLLFFVLFIAALLSIIIMTSRSQLQQAVSVAVKIAGMPVLRRVVTFIDGDKYERLAQTLDESDPFFVETQEKFREIKSVTHCLYLYTMAPRTDKTHIFIFDGEPPGSEGYTPLGMEEDLSTYPSDYWRAYETKSPQFTRVMFQSQWGLLISVYMPILNSKGDAVGVLGIDFEAQDIYDAIWASTWRQIAFFTVAVTIGLFFYFYFLRDLTRQSGELLEINQRAEAASRAKSQFLARMSHEILTPMNIVLGMSKLARRNYGTPKCLEYISGIDSAGLSLLAVINNVLDFSKIESGRLELNASPYETSLLLNDVLAIIRAKLAEKPIELIVGAAPGIPGRMAGDAERVKQVLLNLLGNAVKYTDEGTIRFSLSSEPLGNGAIRLTFVVEDTGIGIRPEDMSRLFDDFTRIDEKRNSAIEGTGLGLPISRSLCLAMGGDITAASEYGSGSIFTATLIQAVSDWAPMGGLINTEARAETQCVPNATPEAGDFSVNQVEYSPAPEIDGVDIVAGMARMGWRPGRYREILRVFRKDAETGFALLESIPDDSSLSAFTTFVHALKSGLANIGAQALSESAAMLEKAGHNGDMGAIRDDLVSFRERLAALMARISEITAAAQSGDAGGESASSAQLREVVAEFKEALANKDMDAMEAALAKLQALRLAPKTQDVVADIARYVLFGDFKKVAEYVILLE